MSAAFGRSDAVADCRSRRSACWVPGRMFRDCSSPPISWFTPPATRRRAMFCSKESPPACR
ncbi:MAG: hypothetical protein L6W00_17070 [Lentisphaeria bacterium]|nr:MAG: hypothetical protein L6W00_17070 [Lentisphaeria bacterium]